MENINIRDLVWKAGNWGVVLFAPYYHIEDFVVIFYDGIKIMHRAEFADEHQAKMYTERPQGFAAE
tara:strand:+ start:582 stop:779 length:198 start_codon:yes stop_codon:yes gene_type:complete